MTKLFLFTLLLSFAFEITAVKFKSKEISFSSVLNKNFFRKTAAVIGSLQFALVSNPSSVFADAVPIIGASAPEFTLPSNAGKSISLKELGGKRTILYFYPVLNFKIFGI